MTATPITRHLAQHTAARSLSSQTWTEPDGIAPRGTLLIIAGRGEAAAVYERFATRVSRDAYRVLAHGDAGGDIAAVRKAVDTVLADRDTVHPVILVGSDSGAAIALELAASGRGEAVVVAGLPVGETAVDALGDEIAARTACPNHQRVLRSSSVEGALAASGATAAGSIDPALLPIVAGAVSVPLLALHGDADAISPFGAALPVYRQAPRAEVRRVVGGRHDVLNDVSHRSVAAEIVLFLERVRATDAAEPIVVAS